MCFVSDAVRTSLACWEGVWGEAMLSVYFEARADHDLRPCMPSGDWQLKGRALVGGQGSGCFYLMCEPLGKWVTSLLHVGGWGGQIGVSLSMSSMSFLDGVHRV